jgi:hypothetical protein
VKVFEKAPERKKKLGVLRKVATATKKSTLRAIRREVTARASVALSKRKASQQRELVRILTRGASSASADHHSGRAIHSLKEEE